MLLLRGICIESIHFLLEKILDSGLRIITIRVDNEDTVTVSQFYTEHVVH
jgi:hypothetical protein